MSYFVVIGTSPFVDTSVACGPYRSQGRVNAAVSDLEAKGYVTEVAQLWDSREIESVINDEGADAGAWESFA